MAILRSFEQILLINFWTRFPPTCLRTTNSHHSSRRRTMMQISAIPQVYTPLQVYTPPFVMRSGLLVSEISEYVSALRQCPRFWAAKRPKFLGFTVLTRRDFTLERAKIQKFRPRLRRDWYQSTYFARHARKLRRFRSQINMISLWN